MSRPTSSASWDAGRGRRRQVSRGSHEGFLPAEDRPDVLETLAAQDATRVPELVPIRYARMSASAFAFFRGGAAVMAGDLATTPTTGITTQLCGDAHLANFGTFATPERRLLLDLDDFDETLRGPFEWDLKRLAASIVIAARHRGFRASIGDEGVLAAVEHYRRIMRELAEADVLDVWYASVDREGLIRAVDEEVANGTTPPRVAIATRRLFERAERRTSAHAAARLTERVDGQVRMREDPPILSRDVLPPQRRELAVGFLADYRDSLPDHVHRLLARYQVIDVARRVVGVGSVGTRAYVVLLHGRDADDPLVLQIKEAGPSVLEDHLAPSTALPAGRRVVHGQRLMQSASDLFLGWLHAVGPDGVERDFYVRQFRDMKSGVDLETITEDGLVAYARLCGRLLANAHARGGEPAEIAGYLGTSRRFAEALVAFARDYADVNARDHARLVEYRARAEQPPGSLAGRHGVAVDVP
jgi:uncharacterized protein (DUF2252 family)